LTPWRLVPGGLLLTVRLTPKGGRDAIDGVAELADGTAVLKARVRAAAHGGDANAALIRLIAEALAIARRDVSLVAGAAARIKQIRIQGPWPALVAALEKACNEQRGST
jgi:uncharacterized protein